MVKKNPRHNNPELKSKQTPRKVNANKEEFGLEIGEVNASGTKQFKYAAAKKYAFAEKAKSEGARRNAEQ